jgi:site-specific DNA recombinase
LAIPVEAVRCAIYTRKSTTEGLDSDFSTLDAQREACEAFIKSQRSQGWLPLSDQYDDGGFTGGNTDRPALLSLLADIQSGRIDCVLVYKVDRLSRSLLDFARLMEVFEANQVSFVSITQQFNTATSMGRLVLNVLLSFAQFEREIISERTSDKMCAARRKGKWLGGPPVLGYDIDRDRKRLVVNPEEVVIVRGLFDLYLQNRSMLKVAREANRRGWKTKSHTTKKGNLRKGLPFDKARLQRILANVTYTGQVNHKGQIFAGEHAAIIDPAVFDQVQEQIRQNTHVGQKAARHPHIGLLKGLMKCGNCGGALAHTYAKKQNRLYRYYLCITKQKRGRDVCDTRPLPAQEIEDHVVMMIRRIGEDPDLREKAFADTVKRRQSQTTKLESERRQLTEEKRQLEKKIERLVAAIASSDTPLTTVGERLRESEELLSRLDHKINETDSERDRLESETVDKDHLIDALARFGSLWEVLVEREKARIMRQLLESITYDPESQQVALVFRTEEASQTT